MTKYILKPRLNDSGFPRSSKFYQESHNATDVLEKAKFPKGYEKLKHMDESVGKHELIGKNTKTGKVYVSKKVPKDLRTEVYFHETHENQIIKKHEKKKRR